MSPIVHAARHHGALVVVDATQAAGWLPVDARDADLLVCAAYKWLLAPRGAAFMVVGERLAERLEPVMANWWATADYRNGYYGPPLRLAETARRFDISPAWFSWVGAAPGARGAARDRDRRDPRAQRAARQPLPRGDGARALRTARSSPSRRTAPPSGSRLPACAPRCGRERPALVPRLQHGRRRRRRRAALLTAVRGPAATRRRR